jgi:mRNA interferase HigB
MIVIGTDVVQAYFKSRAGHKGINAARSQYGAWLAIAESADRKTPEDVKKAHPKASVLKGGRVVFNIKANDYRLIALVQYVGGVLMIRFFGSHEEYRGAWRIHPIPLPRSRTSAGSTDLTVTVSRCSSRY